MCGIIGGCSRNFRRRLFRCGILLMLPFSLLCDGLHALASLIMPARVSWIFACTVTLCAMGTVIDLITRACSPNWFDMPASSDLEDTSLLEVSIQLHMLVTSAMQGLCVCCWASVAAAGVLCAHLSMFTIAHPISMTCSILLLPLRTRSFASEATCRVGDLH